MSVITLLRRTSRKGLEVGGYNFFASAPASFSGAYVRFPDYRAMPTIGTELKEARERLGISVADAAKRLHMRTMFVDALEHDDWKTVGEPVYIRGFLRNYTRMLGLDADRCVEAFNDDPYVRPEPPASTLEDAPYEPTVRFRSRRTLRYPWALAALSAFALFLVVKVVWTMLTPSAVGHAELQPPQASAMVSNGQQTVQPQTGANALAAGGAARMSGVDLRLQLTQSCWLSITVDGRRVVYQTLPAGTVREFHGVHEIALRVGNAGGVIATIDGQQLGTLGDPGQVRDRVFAVRTPVAGQDATHE